MFPYADVLYREGLSSEHVKSVIKRVLIARHGKEDFSLTAQDQMLKVMGSILTVLTAGVAALGGISLVVGAVGIATITTIVLTERTAGIGLTRALGARRRDILGCFLAKAAALGALGGLGGVLLAGVIVATARAASKCTADDRVALRCRRPGHRQQYRNCSRSRPRCPGRWARSDRGTACRMIVNVKNRLRQSRCALNYARFTKN